MLVACEPVQKTGQSWYQHILLKPLPMSNVAQSVLPMIETIHIGLNSMYILYFSIIQYHPFSCFLKYLRLYERSETQFQRLITLKYYLLLPKFTKGSTTNDNIF